MGAILEIGQILKKSCLTFFCHHGVCIWSKFQLHRTFLPKVDTTNVKCQFSRFKVPGPIFGKNWPIFPQYFSKSKKFLIFCGFAWYRPWRYMKNHQKLGLKPFLAPENHDFSLFLLIFSYINYIGKCAISAIPGRTQTRISRARNWIFTFCKKRWKAIE